MGQILLNPAKFGPNVLKSASTCVQSPPPRHSQGTNPRPKWAKSRQIMQNGQNPANPRPNCAKIPPNPAKWAKSRQSQAKMVQIPPNPLKCVKSRKSHAKMYQIPPNPAKWDKICVGTCSEPPAALQYQNAPNPSKSSQNVPNSPNPNLKLNKSCQIQSNRPNPNNHMPKWAKSSQILPKCAKSRQSHSVAHQNAA